MAVYTKESTRPPLHERELLGRLLGVFYRLEVVVTKYWHTAKEAFYLSRHSMPALVARLAALICFSGPNRGAPT